MRDLLIVTIFETKQHLKNKGIIFLMALMVLAAAVVPVIPTFFQSSSNSSQQVDNQVLSDEFKNAAYVIQSDEVKQYLQPKSEDVIADEAALRQLIQDGKYRVGFVIDDLNQVKTIYKSKGFSDMDDLKMTQLLRSFVQIKKLAEKGISPQDYQAIQDTPIISNVDILSVDRTGNVVLAYVCMLLLYTVVFVFGSITSTNIASEKGNRSMELLITSTKPKTLILGKVLSVSFIVFVLLNVIVVTGAISIMINKVHYPEALLSLIQSSFKLDVLLVYLIFMLLGYILYMFLFASMGSIVSKVEDVSSAIAPVTILFVVAYVLANFSLNGPNSMVAVACQWIPFISMFVTPIRYSLVDMSVIELIGSALVLLSTTILMAYMSIRIYRYGTLNYGNKRNIFKAIYEVFFVKQ